MNESVWLTIPTRGRDTLPAIIDGAGLPRERIVLVHTAPDSPHYDGCINLTDLGPLNIHRWWNLGIATATQCGADAVVVANDDIRIGGPTAVPTLAAAANPFAYVAPGRAHNLRRLTGWCWAIRPNDTHIRPDETFRWWFGDDDLEVRAQAAGDALVAATVDITHPRLGSTDTADPYMAAVIHADQRAFAERHLAH